MGLLRIYYFIILLLIIQVPSVQAASNISTVECGEVNIHFIKAIRSDSPSFEIRDYKVLDRKNKDLDPNIVFNKSYANFFLDHLKEIEEKDGSYVVEPHGFIIYSHKDSPQYRIFIEPDYVMVLI
jgi:hypothetical protein